MSEHTKGRLAQSGLHADSESGDWEGRAYFVAKGKLAKENMRRLVACWNSWEGVSTKAIEDVTAKVSPISYGHLERDRDELIAALRMLGQYRAVEAALTSGDADTFRALLAKHAPKEPADG